jgi:arylsulfatase A-like enzyme
MGSHGLRGKQNMYEHTVGVPLLMRAPGISAGRRSDAQCYLHDLYPTVCDLAGVPIPETVRGRSLAPVLRGEVDSVHECVFGYFRDVQRMVRTERWKLIQYPKAGKVQLFDLEADPHEINDRSGDPACAEVLAKLRSKLQAWQREVGDPLLALSGGKK